MAISALILGALAWLLALPSGFVYDDTLTNVLSRTTYLPLLAASAAFAVVVAAAYRRWPALGWVLGVWLGVVLLDGLSHVRRTEILAHEERQAWTELAEQAWANAKDSGVTSPLEVHAVDVQTGFAGSPS